LAFGMLLNNSVKAVLDIDIVTLTTYW